MVLAMMSKIATIYWIPGCTVRIAGGYSSYHFVVVLQVDVVAWKILAYTIRSNERAQSKFAPPLIDLRHPKRFWLWQADRSNLAAQRTWVIRSMRPTRLDYDILGPWHIVRELPHAKRAHLTDCLMKGFYDLNAQHLGHLYATTHTTTELLLRRIDGAVEYVNSVASRSIVQQSNS